KLIVIASFALCLLTLTSPLAPAQSGKPRRKQARGLSDPRLAQLPAELREQGQVLLKEQDAKKRVALVRALGKEDQDDAAEFLLTLIKTDPSADVRRAAIGRIGTSPPPHGRHTLEWSAAFDPDPQVSAQALDKLRQWQVAELSRTLDRRLASARQSRDTAAAP